VTDPEQTAIVCDDYPIFRGGVVSCLTNGLGISVLAEAADGESCIAKLKFYEPRILVADLSMPLIDGFGVLEWIGRNQPGIRTFILSMHTDISFVQRARELGAAGFMAKEDAESELAAAIGSTTSFYTSESIGRKSRNVMSDLSAYALAEKLRKVSDAERRVLVLLTQSLTSKEIAEQLFISVRTVQAHRVSLAAKLGAQGPNKLLELAIRHRDQIIG
jgi:DNA-binding NarL/FixJ family response regulator